jgi:hypothetical protein
MKDLSGNSLLSRILGRDADEDQTSIDSTEAFETAGRSRKRSTPEVGGRPWDFAVELVVETIDDLPSNFPRDSAIRFSLDVPITRGSRDNAAMSIASAATKAAPLPDGCAKPWDSPR